MRALIALWLCLGVVLAQTPNVLLVVADDLGVDNLASYQLGNDLPSTPNLDALAARGVQFRNAYAYASCSPTRAALLTGRHPVRTLVGRHIRHDLNSNPAIGTLRGSELTLPKLLDLAGNGYRHASFGKWHLHDATFPPTAAVDVGGFGHFTGSLAADVPSYFAWPRVAQGQTSTCTTYATTQVTDDALAWLGAQTQPWFCYLAYHAPHAPFHLPPAGLYTRQIGTPPTLRDQYLAMVEALDHELGRLFAALGPTTLANTLVVFVGDNGTPQGLAVPPFRPYRAKTTPYEGGIRVPLLVAGPGVVAPGRSEDALVCAVDVFATVAEVCGAQAALPAWLAIDGISMVPYLQNAAAAPQRQFVFAEEFTGTSWPAPLQNGYTVVRNDRYKLVHRLGGLVEMFDLLADPFEHQDLLLQGVLPPTIQQNFIALIVERNRLRNPTARWQPFGTGCSSAGPVPSTLLTQAPRFGLPTTVQLAGASPNGFALLALGTNARSQGNTTLPLPLLPFGAAAGCQQWFRTEALFARLVDASGAADVTLQIPNLPALLELPMFGGWFVFGPPSPGNPLGLAVATPFASTLGL